MGPPGETSRARRCRTRPQAGPRVLEKPFFASTRAFEDMSLIVKICGLSTPETLEAALDAGADMAGFVFFPPSPRHLSLEGARELGLQTKGRAAKVALTVDADDATLANIVEALQPDMLQLHGNESAARLRDIKKKFRLPVMKVIAVETAVDLESVPVYAGGCRPHPVRCPCSQGGHPARRSRRGIRLEFTAATRARNCRSWSRAALMRAMSRRPLASPEPAASMSPPASRVRQASRIREMIRAFIRAARAN